MHFVPTRVLSVFILGLCTPPLLTANQAIAADSPPPVDFRFADQATAQTLLRQNDTYTATASAFDRKVRMGTGTDLGVTKYLEFVSAQALPWKTNSRQTIEQAITATIEPLTSLGIQLASPVNLIHTTGKEESGAAYTRGNEIIFPTRELGSKDKPPTKLLAHELFHVISRQHPNLRDQLYQLIGFRRANPIELPSEISHLRITNPDAPVIEHVMLLKLSSTDSVHVAPILIAKSDFKVDGPPSLFAYLSFKLMQVKETPDGWVAELTNGAPVYHSPQSSDFQRQIGRNTGYIIHPEEILADNFSLIVTDGQIVDKWLTDKMKTVIKAYFDNFDATQPASQQ
jgi:hypothetical protein